MVFSLGPRQINSLIRVRIKFISVVVRLWIFIVYLNNSLSHLFTVYLVVALTSAFVSVASDHVFLFYEDSQNNSLQAKYGSNYTVSNLFFCCINV